MVSPYLRRRLRSLEEAQQDAEKLNVKAADHAVLTVVADDDKERTRKRPIARFIAKVIAAEA